MKKLTLLLLFACFYLPIFAQDEDKVPRTLIYEFGANASGIANLLLGGDGNVQEQTPYMFTFKFFGEKGRGFRLGFGGKLDYSKPSDADRKDYDNGFDLRLGYERQWYLSSKWVTYLGVDVIGGYENFGANTDFVSTKNKTYNIGTGPIWGIQWMINEHISLHTETAFYYRHTSTTDEVIFDGQDNPAPETVTDDKVNFILPASLYLGVRF